MNTTTSASGRTDDLIVVSNRLPIRQVDGRWELSAGGLVTAMRPVMAQRTGRWVGWDGGADDLPTHLPGSDTTLTPVALSESQVEGYYAGFSNRTLWPLLHDLIETPVFDRDWWTTYRQINQLFARAAVEDGPGTPDSIWWIHDYHLMLLPSLLRDAGAQGTVRFFMHTPWPAPELFARLPWRRQLLEGLLGADAVSFHTERYRKNFARTCGRLLGAEGVTVEGERVRLPDGRDVTTHANPISIDVDEFTDLARSPQVRADVTQLREQFQDRKILLGVDRLDYTKGILERLRAFEALLDRNPRFRDEVTLVQIAVPSRSSIEEYQQLREDVEQLIGRINGSYTSPGGDVPVHYLRRGVPRAHLSAYYCLADVMLVTPLKDGMNLVAKEFVVSQEAIDGDGRLILSEFTGSASELTEAIACNPFDTEGLSHVIEDTLDLSGMAARERIRAMADTVRRRDIHRWAHNELTGAPERHNA